jgi:hypothetical protein
MLTNRFATNQFYLAEDARTIFLARQLRENTLTDSLERDEAFVKKLTQAQNCKGTLNSYGMFFVNVPGTNVKFSVFDVTVRDFKMFVRESAT